MIVVTRKELLAQYGTNKNKATKRDQTGFMYFALFVNDMLTIAQFYNKLAY